MNKIILTGGGTAGHVMPNLAILPYLTAFDEVHYIGSVGGMEEEIVRRRAPKVRFHAIPCVKLVRGSAIKNLLLPIKLIKSVRAAKKLIREISPTVIFSKGGFVGLPVCLAAGRVPVVLHESDLSLGLANRIALKKCDRLLTSFDTGINCDRLTVTGAPICRELYRGNREAAKRLTGLYANKPYLLVTGGSQGARAINEAVEGALDGLVARFNVIHLAGRGNEAGPTLPGYYRAGFSDRMADLMAVCDYALTRGGANTLFELLALGKPALVVPLPAAASRGDQLLNAEYFRARGMVDVLPQDRLSPASLTAALAALTRNAPARRAAIRSAGTLDGTRSVAAILNGYAK